MYDDGPGTRFGMVQLSGLLKGPQNVGNSDIPSSNLSADSNPLSFSQKPLLPVVGEAYK